MKFRGKTDWHYLTSIRIIILAFATTCKSCKRKERIIIRRLISICNHKLAWNITCDSSHRISTSSWTYRLSQSQCLTLTESKDSSSLFFSTNLITWISDWNTLRPVCVVSLITIAVREYLFRTVIYSILFWQVFSVLEIREGFFTNTYVLAFYELSVLTQTDTGCGVSVSFRAVTTLQTFTLSSRGGEGVVSTRFTVFYRVLS